mgnify:FL=1
MNAIPNREDHPLSVAIERLIARQGVLPILAALAATALVWRRIPKRLTLPGSLNSHLRRDIGLPSEPASRKHWQLR